MESLKIECKDYYQEIIFIFLEHVSILCGLLILLWISGNICTGLQSFIVVHDRFLSFTSGAIITNLLAARMAVDPIAHLIF